MYCPKCMAWDVQVLDTRHLDDVNAIRRRRKCPHCGYRFSTIEVLREEWDEKTERGGTNERDT